MNAVRFIQQRCTAVLADRGAALLLLWRCWWRCWWVQVDETRELGAGAFARVVEGDFQGRRVAVKMLPAASSSVFTRKAHAALVQEVAVLSRCVHPNVVRLLGMCARPPHVCLLVELMGQSLHQLLHDPEPHRLLPMEQVRGGGRGGEAARVSSCAHTHGVVCALLGSNGWELRVGG